MTEAIIIALSPDRARKAALGWGWQEVDKRVFAITTTEPDLATILIDRPRSLEGWANGTRAYLVNGWEGRTDADGIRRMLKTGAFVESQP